MSKHQTFFGRSMWVDAKGKLVYLPGGWRKYYRGLTSAEFDAVKDMVSGTVTLKDGTVFTAPFHSVPFDRTKYHIPTKVGRTITVENGESKAGGPE